MLEWNSFGRKMAFLQKKMLMRCSYTYNDRYKVKKRKSGRAIKNYLLEEQIITESVKVVTFPSFSTFFRPLHPCQLVDKPYVN